MEYTPWLEKASNVENERSDCRAKKKRQNPDGKTQGKNADGKAAQNENKLVGKCLATCVSL